MPGPRKSFLLRIDPDLWAEVERWAAAELRSVNGQIEYLLRDAVRRRRGPPSAEAPAPAPGEPPSDPARHEKDDGSPDA